MKIHVIVDLKGQVVATMPVPGETQNGIVFRGASINKKRPPIGRLDISMERPEKFIKPKITVNKPDFIASRPKFVTGEPGLPNTVEANTFMLYEIEQTSDIASLIEEGDINRFHSTLSEVILLKRLKPIIVNK